MGQTRTYPRCHYGYKIMYPYCCQDSLKSISSTAVIVIAYKSITGRRLPAHGFLRFCDGGSVFGFTERMQVVVSLSKIGRRMTNRGNSKLTMLLKLKFFVRQSGCEREREIFYLMKNRRMFIDSESCSVNVNNS